MFRDILSDNNIDTLISESNPKLSSIRTFGSSGGAKSKSDFRRGNYVRVIHKTVQAWIKDVKWPRLRYAEDYVGQNYTYMVNESI